MKKSYFVEVLNKGESIKGFHTNGLNISIDPDEFNDMLTLVAGLSNLLSEATLLLSEQGLTPNDTTLRVFSDDDTLFYSIDELEAFKLEHNIKTMQTDYMSTCITINGIPYKGEIVNGMIPEENSEVSTKLKDIELYKGSIITTYRDSYHSVHQYMLIRDANIASRPYRLLSLTGGYTILVGFKSLNPDDAIKFLEGMKLTVVGIEYPRKAFHL